MAMTRRNQHFNIAQKAKSSVVDPQSRVHGILRAINQIVEDLATFVEIEIRLQQLETHQSMRLFCLTTSEKQPFHTSGLHFLGPNVKLKGSVAVQNCNGGLGF